MPPHPRWLTACHGRRPSCNQALVSSDRLGQGRSQLGSGCVLLLPPAGPVAAANNIWRLQS